MKLKHLFEYNLKSQDNSNTKQYEYIETENYIFLKLDKLASGLPIFVFVFVFCAFVFNSRFGNFSIVEFVLNRVVVELFINLLGTVIFDFPIFLLI